jgi:hypothetical protein
MEKKSEFNKPKLLQNIFIVLPASLVVAEATSSDHLSQHLSLFMFGLSLGIVFKVRHDLTKIF